nr:hypothetical protein Cduv_210 [Cedratvirus duvanny]
MKLSFPVLYEIFQIGDLENSLALCCREFYSVLTSENFWKERLRGLGLPLLEKGNNFLQWKSIYYYSLEVNKQEKKKSILLPLCKVSNLEYITCTEVQKEKVFGFLSLARKYRAYRSSSEIFLQISPGNYKITSTEKGDFFTSKFAKKMLFYAILSNESYNALLYKLTYLLETNGVRTT